MVDQVDDFLAHYGVKGMKWGKRKGSLKSRISGARRDANQRRLVTAQRVANGEAQARDILRSAGPASIVGTILLPGVGTVGAAVVGGSRRFNQSRVRRLTAQRDRMDAGKTQARDIVDAAFNIPVTDLFISRTDRRG